MISDITIFGLTLELYDIFFYGSLVVMILFNLWYMRFYGYKAGAAVFYTVAAYALGYALIVLVSMTMHGGKIVGINYIRAVLAIPVAMYLLCLITKANFPKVLDFLTPCAALMHGVSHVGCIFAGCCHGFPCEWGIPSPIFDYRLFPNQLLEAASSLVIWVFLMLYSKRKNFITGGKVYPWYLATFGGTRFLWEYLRDNPKDALGISELAYYALAAFVAGVIALIVLRIREKRTGRIAGEIPADAVPSNGRKGASRPANRQKPDSDKNRKKR